MKKTALFLLLVAVALPLCSATLVDVPNSVSCQVNEVVLSEDGQSSSMVREDITQIDLDKYWNVWCYVQDASMQPISNALVVLQVDGIQVDASNSVGGFVNFPVIRTTPAVPAYYSTSMPGAGTHNIRAYSGSLQQYEQTLTVGQASMFGDTLILAAILAVVAVIGFLAWKILRGGKRR